MTSRLSRIATYVVLITFCIVVLVPIIGFVFAALQPSGSLVRGFALPDQLRLSNFAEAWTAAKFSTFMTNSVVVTATVTVVVVVLSTLMGYAFGTLRFKGRDLLFLVLLAGMVIPDEAVIVPRYYEFRSAGLLNTYWALILPQIGTFIVFGTFWMRAFFLASPREIIDAARIDGAGSWAILWRVLVPLGRPAITTMALLVSMWSWNNFLLPLVMVTDESLLTAPLGLTFFRGEFTTNLPLLSAASVIVALPMVVLYVFMQRHFIRGILTGSLVE
jgi:raffinose/stachyose/melibiose transport system permease protein